jgi:hypothetical protein
MGSLAKHNVYEIGECLHAKVKEKEDMKERKTMKTGIHKFEQEHKNNVRFKKAFQKYRDGIKLTREDLIVLIT